MIIDKTCLCGGYWDWAQEDLQRGWSLKPDYIPSELEDKSKINGWVWSYICNVCGNNQEDIESLIIKNNSSEKSEIVNLFAGGGTSSSSSGSSSSCRITCKTCPPVGNAPCGTTPVTLGPPACEDCNGNSSGGTITCDLPIPLGLDGTCGSSSSSSVKHCAMCGAAAGSPHNFSCVFRNYTNPNDQCYE